MAKSGRKPGPQSRHAASATQDAPGARRPDTRTKLVEAALATLREDGFSGASARAIALRAAVNQSQIFYYFGSVNGLLVAAFEHTSNERIVAVAESTKHVTTVDGLFAAVQEQLHSEFASGQMKVLSELVTASATDAQLRAAVTTLIDPWLDLTRSTIDRVRNGMLTSVLPSDDAAFAVVALFIGMELLMNLTGDDQKVRQLFAVGRQFAALLDAFGQAGVQHESDGQRRDETREPETKEEST